jgi:hypothetical protein
LYSELDTDEKIFLYEAKNDKHAAEYCRRSSQGFIIICAKIKYLPYSIRITVLYASMGALKWTTSQHIEF